MKLRVKGEISEDCPNFHKKSPFNNNKEIIKPYLDFFFLKDQAKEFQIIQLRKFWIFNSLISQIIGRFMEENI